ncbi:hypothetical protein COOONC_14292, partial [Cooperia oncophora]
SSTYPLFYRILISITITFQWQTSVVVRWPLPFIVVPPFLTITLVLATAMDFQLNTTNDTLQVFLPDTMQSISDLKELMNLFPPRDAQRDSYSIFGSKFASFVLEDVDGNAVSPKAIENVAALHKSIMSLKAAKALRIFYLLEPSNEVESWIDTFLEHMDNCRANSSSRLFWTSSKSLASEMERNSTVRH